jgi:preprotein translocase subunit SecA
LYDPRAQWASYLLNALKAKELFLKDVSYIVRAGEVRSPCSLAVELVVPLCC